MFSACLNSACIAFEAAFGQQDSAVGSRIAANVNLSGDLDRPPSSKAASDIS